MATDWLKLKTDYLSTPVSLRALAVQNGVNPRTLQTVAAREGWAAAKRSGNGAAQPNGAKTHAKTPSQAHSARQNTAAGVPLPAQEPSERRARLLAIGDQLTDQLARAAVELDKQVLKHKRKTREMVYDDAQAKGKPVEETVEENYELEIVDATVNCAGLQKLSAALKNLCDVTAAGDSDGQSVGMVAQLMKKLDEEAGREGDADALHDPQTT